MTDKSTPYHLTGVSRKISGMGGLMTKLGPPPYRQYKCHLLNVIVKKATGMKTCTHTSIGLRCSLKFPLDTHLLVGLTGEKNSPWCQRTNQSILVIRQTIHQIKCFKLQSLKKNIRKNYKKLTQCQFLKRCLKP